MLVRSKAVEIQASTSKRTGVYDSGLACLGSRHNSFVTAVPCVFRTGWDAPYQDDSVYFGANAEKLRDWSQISPSPFTRMNGQERNRDFSCLDRTITLHAGPPDGPCLQNALSGKHSDIPTAFSRAPMCTILRLIR